VKSARCTAGACAPPEIAADVAAPELDRRRPRRRPRGRSQARRGPDPLGGRLELGRRLGDTLGVDVGMAIALMWSAVAPARRVLQEGRERVHVGPGTALLAQRPCRGLYHATERARRNAYIYIYYTMKYASRCSAPDKNWTRAISCIFSPAHALTTGPVALEAARMAQMSSISCMVMGVCVRDHAEGLPYHLLSLAEQEAAGIEKSFTNLSGTTSGWTCAEVSATSEDRPLVVFAADCSMTNPARKTACADLLIRSSPRASNASRSSPRMA